VREERLEEEEEEEGEEEDSGVLFAMPLGGGEMIMDVVECVAPYIIRVGDGAMRPVVPTYVMALCPPSVLGRKADCSTLPTVVGRSRVWKEEVIADPFPLVRCGGVVGIGSGLS
jgi:hypothetical protein